MIRNEIEKANQLCEEIAQVKHFLLFCGKKYHDAISSSKHSFSIVSYCKRLLPKSRRTWNFRENWYTHQEEHEIPSELQDRIIDVMEDYVTEKEAELAKM